MRVSLRVPLEDRGEGICPGIGSVVLTLQLSDRAAGRP